MKLLIFWILFSIGAMGSLSAAHPVLEVAEIVPHRFGALLQPLQLWTVPDCAWELRCISEELDVFWVDQHQTWHSAKRICGSKNSLLQTLQLAVELPWLSPGTYTAQVALEMVEGSGIVLYQTREELWLLPLNSSEFVLRSRTGDLRLVSDQWYCAALAADAELYYEDYLVWPADEAAVNPRVQSQTVPSGGVQLKWRQAGFAAEIGDCFAVTLEVTAGFDAVLHLSFSDGLIPLFETWRAGERALEVIPAEDGYLVPLSSELHVIHGLVMAGFAESGEQRIRAVIGEQEAVLKGEIQRGWFGKQGKVVVYVSEGGRPAANHQLILPTGELAATNNLGCLSFTVEPGLYRIISRQTGQIRWFEVGTSQFCFVNFELTDRETRDRGVIWDLSISPKLAWNLAVFGPDLLLNFKPEQALSLKTAAGNVGIDCSLGSDHTELKLMYIHSQEPVLMQCGSWTWRQTGQNWQGEFRTNNLVLRTDLRSSRGEIQFLGFESIHIDPYWRIRLQPSAISAETAAANWRLGITAASDRNFGIKLAPTAGRWQLLLNHDSLGVSGTCGVPGWHWQLRLETNGRTVLGLGFQDRQHELEIEIKQDAESITSGLRLQRLFQAEWGRVAAGFSSYRTQNAWFAETVLCTDFPVTDSISFHIDWCGHYDPRGLKSLFDLGLSFDASAAFAKVGWNQKQGCYFRLGLSLAE